MTLLSAWWPWLLIGVAGVVILLVFVWWLWWRLPRHQVGRLRFVIRDPKARTDVEANFRKTAGQLLGGAAVLIQQQPSHDLLISNQVSKGFGELGGDKMPVRLGGIFALEGVMNTSAQYHQPVLEAPCAFVRNESRRRAGDKAPITEIQAVLPVIGRRKAGAGAVNLSGAHIPKAELSSANPCAAPCCSAPT